MFYTIILASTLFLIFFISPVEIRILFRKESSDEYLKIQTVYLGFIKFDLKVPRFFIKIKELVPVISFDVETLMGKQEISKGEVVSLPKDKDFRNYMMLLTKLPSRLKELYPIYRMLPKSLLSRLELNLYFGLENPASAAILSGSVYMVCFTALAFLSEHLDLSRTKIKVKAQPNLYKQASLKIRFFSIIRVRVGHIIIASIFIFRYWITSKRKRTKKIKGAKMHGRSSY